MNKNFLASGKMGLLKRNWLLQRLAGIDKTTIYDIDKIALAESIHSLLEEVGYEMV
jgi:hypothetical protein